MAQLIKESVVITWNDIFLQAVRGLGGAPGPIARIGAMMHVAIFDTVNLLTGQTYESYAPGLPDPAAPQFVGADPGRSAAFAASKTLFATIGQIIPPLPAAAAVGAGVAAVGSGPEDQFRHNHAFDLRKVIAPAAASGPQAVAAGPDPSQLFGEAVAQALLDHRSADGSSAGLSDPPTPPLDPAQAGEWRPTGSGAALTPKWGLVTPFGGWLTGQITDFLPQYALNPNIYPTYSAFLTSRDYAAQVDEVRRLGGDGIAAPTERSAEETEIAFFWANDANGTFKPPGQLYTITQIVARSEKTADNLLETARLFALVGIAMADAAVVAWHVKYLFPNVATPIRLWRPESAIAEPQNDGNPSTAPVPGWKPLSVTPAGVRFSPPFPAYISGHATFGAAHAAMMRLYYGRDSIGFTATTEDPSAKDASGKPLKRRFTSFTEAARENGRSRVYLGVHYQIDAEGGFESGTKVAEFGFANVLRPV